MQDEREGERQTRNEYEATKRAAPTNRGGCGAGLGWAGLGGVECLGQTGTCFHVSRRTFPSPPLLKYMLGRIVEGNQRLLAVLKYTHTQRTLNSVSEEGDLRFQVGEGTRGSMLQ